jgi:hypothetical protein
MNPHPARDTVECVVAMHALYYRIVTIEQKAQCIDVELLEAFGRSMM